jgi:hypothetical protein
MKASPFSAALLALIVPTAALANTGNSNPAPAKETGVKSVLEAKQALDDLEAAFAKLRPGTNAKLTVQPGAPLNGMPAPNAPPPQPLYGVFPGPKPSPVTHPTPPPQPLYGVFPGPKPSPVVHPTPHPQPLYGVFAGPKKPIKAPLDGMPKS